MKKVVEIVRQTLNENINGENLNKSRTLRDKMFSDLFSESDNINESNQEKTNDVLEKIKNNDFEQQNATSFRSALMKSKHKEMLTDYSESELSKMKLFKLDGYDIGFALKYTDRNKHDEIVAVFNNEEDVKGIGKELVMSAVWNGGCFLDHYDGYLSNLYSGLGFVEYDRYKFDPQYDPDGKFRNKYGEADVIFRRHKNCS